MVSWVLGIVLQLGERNSGFPTLSCKDFIVGNVYFVVLASCCGNNQIETGFLYLCPLIGWYIAVLYLKVIYLRVYIEAQSVIKENSTNSCIHALFALLAEAP